MSTFIGANADHAIQLEKNFEILEHTANSLADTLAAVDGELDEMEDALFIALDSIDSLKGDICVLLELHKAVCRFFGPNLDDAYGVSHLKEVLNSTTEKLCSKKLTYSSNDPLETW